MRITEKPPTFMEILDNQAGAQTPCFDVLSLAWHVSPLRKFDEFVPLKVKKKIYICNKFINLATKAAFQRKWAYKS